MAKIAVFPGTFDPITLGHYNIVKKSLKLFDTLYLSIGENTNKNHFFSLEDRIAILQATFADEPNLYVTSFSGLTVDFCQEMGAQFIVRGTRNISDFETEKAILEMNQKLNPAIETVLLTTDPEYNAISSTIVREIIRNDGDLRHFVPERARDYISQMPNS